MGATLSAQTGDRIRIEASARLNPDLEALDRLELVIHGDIVQVARSDENHQTISLTREQTLGRGVWIAVRAYGVDQAAAHSAPVYVETDGQGFWRFEKVPELVTAMRERLTELETLSPTVSEELEPWELTDSLDALWREQRGHIAKRIEQALDVYEGLANAAREKLGD